MKFLKPLAILAVIGGLTFTFWPNKKSGARQPLAPAFEAKAEKRDILETVEAAGFVRAVIYSNIRAEVSGKLQKLYVQTGDMVKKDQVLAELDPVLAKADADEAGRTLQLQKFTLEKITMGNVLAPAPEVKLAITRSSSDSVKASSQPEAMAGAIRGRVMSRVTAKGLPPRSIAASSSDWSMFASRACTITAT